MSSGHHRLPQNDLPPSGQQNGSSLASTPQYCSIVYPSEHNNGLVNRGPIAGGSTRERWINGASLEIPWKLVTGWQPVTKLNVEESQLDFWPVEEASKSLQISGDPITITSPTGSCRDVGCTTTIVILQFVVYTTSLFTDLTTGQHATLRMQQTEVWAVW